MKYISVQPDSPYYLWQLKVQISNFRELGIESDYIIVLATNRDGSEEAKALSNQTSASIVFLPDKRTDFYYISSIRPHLLKHIDIWDDYDVIYIDSDVIFNRNIVCSCDKVLLSDAKSYIGTRYIKSKGVMLFKRMCDVVGIDPEIVERNDSSAGGAQYYFPRGSLSLEFWNKVEIDSVNLYKLMQTTRTLYYDKDGPIQGWCADMWAILWNLWLFDVETEISEELDFNFATDRIKSPLKPIFHLAGITEKLSKQHFFKGDFIDKSPFGCKLNSVDGLCYNRYIDQIRVAEKMFG